MVKVKSDRLVKKMDIKTIAPLEDVVSLIFKYSINAGIKVDVHTDTARVDNGSEEKCIVIKNGEFKDNYLTYVVVQRQYGILSYANVYETGESLNAKKMSKNAQHNKKMDFVLDDLVHGGGAHGGGFKLMNMAYNKVAASANKISEKEVEAEQMYYELVAQVVMLSLEEAGKNVQSNVNHVSDTNTKNSTNTTYTETSKIASQTSSSTNTQNNSTKDFKKDYAEFVNNYNNASNGPRHIDPNGSKSIKANSNSENSNTNVSTEKVETNTDAFAGFENSTQDVVDKANEMLKKNANTKENTNSSDSSKDKLMPSDKSETKKFDFAGLVVWMIIAIIISAFFPAAAAYILVGAFILYIIDWIFG